MPSRPDTSHAQDHSHEQPMVYASQQEWQFHVLAHQGRSYVQAGMQLMVQEPQLICQMIDQLVLCRNAAVSLLAPKKVRPTTYLRYSGKTH
jgi:flagellar basal body-associated protein FliL